MTLPARGKNLHHQPGMLQMETQEKGEKIDFYLALLSLHVPAK
jgi:hypothetical protein